MQDFRWHPKIIHVIYSHLFISLAKESVVQTAVETCVEFGPWRTLVHWFTFEFGGPFQLTSFELVYFSWKRCRVDTSDAHCSILLVTRVVFNITFGKKRIKQFLLITVSKFEVIRPITTNWLDPSVVYADDNQTPMLVKGLQVSSKGTWLSRDCEEEGTGKLAIPITTDSDSTIR